MRTRELLHELEAVRTLPSCGSNRGKQIVEMCGRLERADLVLRQARRAAEQLLRELPGKHGKRYEPRFEVSPRLAALLNEAAEGDAKGAGAPAVTSVRAGVREQHCCRFDGHQPHRRGRGRKLYSSFYMG